MFSKKVVTVGNVKIGGDNPIVIQSMTNTDTLDFESTLRQIIRLSNAGAEIVRVSVRTLDDIPSFKKLCENSNVPLVADIHFDYKVAIEAIKAGASKVRINPGNIGAEWKVKEVAKVAKEYGIPIRVGANSGSIKKKYENLVPRYRALAESALEEVRILEKIGFDDIVISIKSTDAKENFLANKCLAEKVQYPIHIGITEAGIYEDAVILSSAGLGALLLNYIGDTIRISIAGDPEKEVGVARKLLTLLGFKKGPRVIACPTCARTEINVEELALKVKEWTKDIDKEINIAVMGCVVNGPGEAKHADIGIAGTKTGGAIFVNGEIVESVSHEKLEETFKRYIEKMNPAN
ncbi:4-hydroxy-3-methylbut-2-en-1-yl diphosphate synthase [Marinitoga sp. 1135]|uniref:4-hydroxy-3-methylbut-2-en-1-yl diphosphate synthase (flavodoxin) n=1 Tax=Marinitoga piezophila (strain DSM 14283 / JCM 11233 / KA3) TaxID=443254 RepID=H2J7M5_MARPK|nr:MULTISPECIES: flavodoxin-dependent (E)-4-hydroxy-3-methylbut-2-enyl-diphosphate synthase [Marinitoga]AEX85366.1 1-hydroxy-2-methyl-2-(E)-butenyl 4-diphosphate synthase [Marinitoga piezophila KA3]APT75844.1 4-hydroxy-3-methylbut-2-en-1-yl diphosphate synthase [Marinitoga sp. 1137]NUU95621.1 4-hydroxy-3-methylbut-2-en-1-yl diphosphate synthase [Marinitoga sp. 1135]NUU97500.1 4-hydroxy-3-methylbut-2-en-1-yl diphosphate synthase [Marinitoga sp. 1138]